MVNVTELEVLNNGSVFGTILARENRRGKTYIEVKLHKEYSGNNDEVYRVYGFNKHDLIDLEELLPGLRAALDIHIDDLHKKREQDSVRKPSNRRGKKRVKDDVVHLQDVLDDDEKEVIEDEKEVVDE